MVIKTKRLLIRPFVYEDLEKLIEIFSDPLVMCYLGGPRVAEKVEEQFEAAQEYFNEHNFGLMALIEKSSEKLIGRVGFISHIIDGIEELELAWLLAKDFWDHGYATEAASVLRDYAFARLKRRRLIAIIAPENQRSIKVAHKIGMCCEKEIVVKEIPAYLFSREKK